MHCLVDQPHMHIAKPIPRTWPMARALARATTTAVLPTPGSPRSTGLFFVRLRRMCDIRCRTSSRPTMGSRRPWRASSVRSRPKRTKNGTRDSLHPLGAVSSNHQRCFLSSVLIQARWGAPVHDPFLDCWRGSSSELQACRKIRDPREYDLEQFGSNRSNQIA
jgi:hypothetical protein